MGERRETGNEIARHVDAAGAVEGLEVLFRRSDREIGAARAVERTDGERLGEAIVELLRGPAVAAVERLPDLDAGRQVEALEREAAVDHVRGSRLFETLPEGVGGGC